MEIITDEKCSIRLLYTCAPAEEAGHDMLVGGFRYQLGKKLGDCIDKELALELDYVVPVPESGAYYAMGLAESLKVPYLQALVKHNENERTMPEDDQAKRDGMIRKNMLLLPGLLEGKKIALVDEAVFTGTTLNTVCSMLKEKGVKGIHIMVPTSRCKNTCPHGIMAKRKLLAKEMSNEDMRVYFGVDSITFLPYNLLSGVTNGFKPVCLECFG